MGWSTRQLAELAGTSLRTVRHYHDVGLLAEPQREANGYKQYGVVHLVRLLEVKRLTELGFSLVQIAEMEETDGHPVRTLRTIDAELAVTIERLQRARIELALVLRDPGPIVAPRQPGTVGDDHTDTYRWLLVVMAQFLGPSSLEAVGELIRTADVLPGGEVCD